jgi:hypothetical protein
MRCRPRTRNLTCHASKLLAVANRAIVGDYSPLFGPVTPATWGGDAAIVPDQIRCLSSGFRAAGRSQDRGARAHGHQMLDHSGELKLWGEDDAVVGSVGRPATARLAEIE